VTARGEKHNRKEEFVKKILLVVIGLVVLAFASWAAAGPGCCSKAKSTTSASASGEKAEKASAAHCEPKETKSASAAGEVDAEGAACVEKAVKLSITGMHCPDCSKKIKAALEHLEGVCASKVSYTRKNAEVVYDANQLSEEGIVQAVRTAGFTVASTKASNWKAAKCDEACKAKKSAKAAESET
jgi:Cu+-exporting ATPase